jgi:DNA (cytosine-5)-methyltransferase 1
MKKNIQKKLTAIDLFSGCGGLTLGLKQAGFKVIGAVEIDSLAADTYSGNHPEVKVWEEDIRKLKGSDILRTLKIKKGQLDLLAGCPPCQGFSSMRTQNGKKRIVDKRNDLVFEYLRLVKELRPKAVMMENVPALAENHRMKTLKKELETLGYDSNNTPMVLNTANYGVPQRRRRMILVSSRVGQIELPKGKSSRVTVRDAIGALERPGKTGDVLHDFPEKRSAEVMEMIKLVPKDGGSRMDLPVKFHLECHKNYPDGFKDVYGRMSWKDVAPTITGGCVSPSKGRFLHPSQNRSITLREAALLQTFPADYFFSLKNGKQGVALMIGNALPPEFIKQHALAIKRVLVESR